VPSSHITYSEEFHWRMAAHWSNIPFEQFIDKDGMEQSRLVATYETAKMIDAVSANEAHKEANRKGKRGRR